MAPRLSVVGHDNQLHVVRADGTGRSQVTWPKQLDASARWGGVSAEDMASWPCWSPDGRWLACFQVGADGMGAGVACGDAMTAFPIPANGSIEDTVDWGTMAAEAYSVEADFDTFTPGNPTGSFVVQ